MTDKQLQLLLDAVHEAGNSRCHPPDLDEVAYHHFTKPAASRIQHRLNAAVRLGLVKVIKDNTPEYRLTVEGIKWLKAHVKAPA